MEAMNRKDLNDLRKKLRDRDGGKCHYCNIEEEDVRLIWGEIYGGIKRGGILEVDRKNNSQGHTPQNCVLACAVCNIAKSDIFTYEEFKRVGAVIRKIWQGKMERRKRG